MYKAFQFYTPYTPLSALYPLLFTMPGVPTGPRHLSKNALFPAPPECPEGIPKKIYRAAEDSSSTLMATNFPNPERQLKLFLDVAAPLVRNNKLSRFPDYLFS